MSAAIKNGQLKLSKWLEILFTFLGVRDASFHYKLFPLRFLKELLKANLRIFSLLRDSGFSGNITVNQKLSFELKFSCGFRCNSIQIHTPFLFLTVQSFLFQISSDADVTPNITYLLLWLETWNLNTQENFRVVENN